MQNRLALILLGLTSVAAGVLAPVHPVTPQTVLLGQIPAMAAWVLLYLWYKSDVASRGLLTSTQFNGFVIALSFIAVPVYLIRSRGLLPGLRSALLFYGAALSWSVVAAIASVVFRNAHAG